MSTKQKIIEQAGELFLRYGIRSISMDEVASNLGMSKKTIYQYIENKDELIQQIILNHVQQDLDTFAGIREQSENSIEELMRFGKYLMESLRKISPAVMYDLQKYHQDSWCQMEELHKKFIYSLIRENIERGQAQKLYREEIDVDIAARLYVGASMLVMDEDSFPIKDYRKDRVMVEIIHQFIHGWASDEGLEIWKLHIIDQKTNN